MMLRKMIKYIPLVTFFLLCSCVMQPKSFIQSNVEPGYKAKSSKDIYFVSYLGIMQKEFNEKLKKSVENNFLTAGYTCHYITSNGLELDPKVHVEKSKLAGSSLVVTLSASDATLEYRKLSNVKYRLSAYDVGSEKTIFKSLIDFYPYKNDWATGVNWEESTANKLASDIVDELKKNSVI